MNEPADIKIPNQDIPIIKLYTKFDPKHVCLRHIGSKRALACEQRQEFWVPLHSDFERALFSFKYIVLVLNRRPGRVFP